MTAAILSIRFKGERVMKKNTAEQYFVYMLSNPERTVIYTGVTNNLKKRVREHKSRAIGGFVEKYNATELIFFEVFDEPYSAMTREREIKNSSLQRKETLIESMNKSWDDLYEKLGMGNK